MNTNKKHYDPSNITVLVLCGGKGSRLQNVLKGTPKILAPIHNKTLIDIQLTNLMYEGFRNIVLCTGYLRSEVRNYVNKNKNIIPYRKLSISFSEEDEPLGTGGALKNTFHNNLITSEDFIVINGDTVHNTDFKELYDYHISHDKLLTILLSEKKIESGLVILLSIPSKEEPDIKKGQILKFDEKASYFANSGIYVFKKSISERLPIYQSFSLENDLIPQLIKLHECNGIVSTDSFIDIGTPERYNLYREMTCPK